MNYLEKIFGSNAQTIVLEHLIKKEKKLNLKLEKIR